MSDRPESTDGPATDGVRTDGGWDDEPEEAESTPDTGTEEIDTDPDGWAFEMVDERGDDTDADAEPLSGLARRLDERKNAGENGSGEAFDELSEEWTGEGAAPSDADELFEEMDVSNIDTEALWDSVLNDDDPDPVDFGPDGDLGVPAGDNGEWGAAFEDDESESVVVPKRSHCESCYFFTSPPEAACTYEGSEVVEVVDSEQFLVKGCPVVAGVVDTDGSPVGEDDGLAAETSD